MAPSLGISHKQDNDSGTRRQPGQAFTYILITYSTGHNVTPFFESIKYFSTLSSCYHSTSSPQYPLAS